MAVTQLADIYNPLVFNAVIDEKVDETNKFIASGVMVTNPMLSAMAAIGGNIGELPFYGTLDIDTEPDRVDDDPTHFSVPGKIAKKKMTYRLASLHYSWSTMDLARELALRDPLAAITARISNWWVTQQQRRLLAAVRGVLADNIANDDADMVKNIYSDVASPAASTLIGVEAIMDAGQTMGDSQGALAAIAMHSITYNALMKQNLVAVIPNSRGEVEVATYLGKRIIVDDDMVVTTGTNSPKYLTVLFGAGAFDHGAGSPMIPSELERIPSAGYGGGQDILHSRRSDIIHPYGMSFTSANVAGQSATLAELALATNWDRAVTRKNIPMAFLTHN